MLKRRKIKNSILLFLCFFIFVFLCFSFVHAQVDLFADVGELQSQISDKKTEVEQLQSRVNELQQKIRTQRGQAASLSNQIAVLNSRIEQAEVEIELSSQQIEQTNLEIAQTQLDITKTEETISNRKEKLARLVRSLDRLDQDSDIDIILTYNSISEFFDQFEATMQVQRTVNTYITELKGFKEELQVKSRNLSDKQKTLISLRDRQEENRSLLERQSIARVQLLSETKNSEIQFSKLLQQAKAEQISVNADIQGLEKVIRQRLEREGQNGLKKLAGVTTMSYPVPFRGVTAYFHDPDYPYRYVFEHPAVDLRASQGTLVKAAAPGFVARARDAGMGYSYVMLIHADGFSTVYGHVSKILVEEDQFVNQGDVIALSGGAPGTPGAWNLTTGAHLHWEVRKDGIPVNPLNYVGTKVAEGEND